MKNLFFHPDPWAGVARTGFYAALTWYAVFFAADWLRPGFVSRYFSVHLLLMVAAACAVWWGSRERT